MFGKLFLIAIGNNIKIKLRQGNFVVIDSLIHLSSGYGKLVRCGAIDGDLANDARIKIASKSEGTHVQIFEGL